MTLVWYALILHGNSFLVDQISEMNYELMKLKKSKSSRLIQLQITTIYDIQFMKV